MTSQPLDEETILEVAREIRSPRTRAKYLRQVCHDQRLLGRLEGRLRSTGRRWQFSLRSLIIVLFLGGSLVAAATATALKLAQAQRAVELARMKALVAAANAEAARAEAELLIQKVAGLRDSEQVDP